MPNPKATELYIFPLRAFLEGRLAILKDQGVEDEYEAGNLDGRESAYGDVLQYIETAERKSQEDG